MRNLITSFILGLVCFTAIGAAEQGSSAPAPADTAAGNIHVYVLTFGPGDDVWEKFGHNAIRIVNDNTEGAQHDVVFNWGVFSFEKGVVDFALNFLQGKLMYSMGVDPDPTQRRSRPNGLDIIDYYEHALNRSVYQQELNLSARQKLDLWNRLADAYNDPKQRNYRYDYYTNNCCTKIRDVVDNVADHRLAAITKNTPSGATYRRHTDRLTASAPWLYVLLQGAMGHPVDEPIDQWQEMFLPKKLHDRLEQVTVHVDGYDVPLVKKSEVLYESTRLVEPSKPPVMAPWLLCVGLVIGGLTAGLGQVSRRHWTLRVGFVLVSLPWLLLMGVGGGLLWWGWFFTDHVVARYNENVMHVSVLALPLIVLTPMLAFSAKRGRVLTRRLALVMVGISLFGVALKVLPWFHQVNWPIISLCLPANAGLAYAVWVMAKMDERLVHGAKVTTKRTRAFDVDRAKQQAN